MCGKDIVPENTYLTSFLGVFRYPVINMSIKDEKIETQATEPVDPYDELLASQSTGSFIDHMADFARDRHIPIINVIQDFADESQPYITRMKALQVLEELTGDPNINLYDEIRIDIKKHEVTYKCVTKKFKGLQWKLIERAESWIQHIVKDKRAETWKGDYRSVDAESVLQRDLSKIKNQNNITSMISDMNNLWKTERGENIFHFSVKTKAFSIFPFPVNKKRTGKKTKEDLGK